MKQYTAKSFTKSNYVKFLVIAFFFLSAVFSTGGIFKNTPLENVVPDFGLTVHAAGDGGGGGGNDNGDAGGAFNNVMNTLITWLIRIGGVIAFIGAVMFAISMREGGNQANERTTAVLVLVSGFFLIAICAAADQFGFFA